MKTLQKIKLTSTKTAKINDNDGAFYVQILQSYDYGNNVTEIDVLQAKTYKTMQGALKFVESWKR